MAKGTATKAALRGAIAFGIGRLIAEPGRLWVSWAPDWALGAPEYAGQILYFAGGFVAMVLFLCGSVDRRPLFRSAIGFGLAYWLLFFATLASGGIAMSGERGLLWAVCGHALCFGAAGGLGTIFFDRRLAGIGVAAFAVAGAATGAALHFVPADFPRPLVMAIPFLPYVLGGALFGAGCGLGGGSKKK
ncbi:MAG: hypothetical protein ACYTAN_15440 [Planctomycetota bacterium]